MSRGLLFATVALAACGGSDDPPDPILVSAYRYDAVNNCDAELSAGDPSNADLIAAMVPSQRCDSDSLPSSYMVKVGDRVDLVIDYGDVNFSEATVVTPPTITATIDGTTSTLNTSLVLQPKLDKHTYFKGSFAVPARPHAVLELLVQASADFARDRSLVFQIDDADLQVAIDECADQTSCAVLAGSQVTARISASGQTAQTVTLRASVGTTDAFSAQVNLNRPIVENRVEGVQKLDVPVVSGAAWFVTAELGPSTAVHTAIGIGDPGLSVTASCPAPCLGGEANATLVVSSDVNRPQTVQLRQLINGVPQTAVQSVTLDDHMGTGFAKTLTLAMAGVQAATNVTFRAELGQFQSEVATVIVNPPDVAITITGCAVAPCSALAGASTLIVNASVAGTHTQQIALRALLNGLPQPGSLGTITANQLENGRMKGFITLDPPVASNNSTWTIVGELVGNASVFDAIAVTLSLPTVSVYFDGCDGSAPCEMQSGVGRAAVSLAVQGSKTQHLVVHSLVDNIQQSSQEVDLSQVVGGQALGTLSIDVPVAAIGSTWTLTTNLGDAGGVSTPVTLVTPSITAMLACGATCHPPSGQTSSVAISAPLGLRDKSVTVQVTSSSGSSTVVNDPTALTVADEGTQTISGSVAIPIPTTPNQVVQIDVLVGGFRAPTLLVTAGL